MENGWRIDLPGVREVIEGADVDARVLSSGLGEIQATLDDVAIMVDDVVGPAVRRLEERFQESAGSVDRRAAEVVEAGRVVVREHLSADEEMAAVHTSRRDDAEAAGRRFTARIAR